MKHLIGFILLIFSIGSQAQNICVSVTCKDTVKYPIDTVVLNSIVTSADGIASTTWQVATGTVKIDSPKKQITVARGLSKGGNFFVFIMVGVSGKGAVGSAFDTVVYLGNKPPVAVVGPSIASVDGTAVLSGSNSTDPEGLPLTFSWKQLSGPTTAAIASPTMSNPLVTGMINGTYVFTLTVTDQSGLTSSASQLVQVNIPVIIKVIKTVTTITALYAADGITITSTTTVVTTFYSDGSTKSVTTTVP
jgi:K319-like protein